MSADVIARSAPRRTALITGASSGLGAALAPLFAADRWNLVLVARGVEAMEALANSMRATHGVDVTVLGVDLAEPGAAAGIARTLAERGLVVDALVNNAGFSVFGPYVETDGAEETRIVQVNVTALMELTKLLLPGMVARRSGRVLNVASTAAFFPGPLMSVYYATKAFVLSYSIALAEELRGSGVTVTALCPGPTRTDFQARAGMQRSRLFQGPLVADAESVVRAGYDGMLRGDGIVVPGMRNRILAQSSRLAPRALLARIVHRLQSSG